MKKTLLIILCLLPGCSWLGLHSDTYNIKESREMSLSIARRLNNVDFSLFKDRGISIVPRYPGNYKNYLPDTKRYLLHIYSMECGNYWIYYNEYKNSIERIVEEFYRHICGWKSIEESEIRQLFDAYLKYGFATLGVNTEGNVLISVGVRGPFLLKKSPSSSPPENDGYKKLEGDWYWKYSL